MTSSISTFKILYYHEQHSRMGKICSLLRNIDLAYREIPPANLSLIT